MKRICPNCNKIFIPKTYNIARGGGKYCSKDCYYRGPKVANKIGVNSPFWKGEGASLSSIHEAMKKVNGKAIKCENPTCSGKSKTFDWALLKDKKYEDRNPKDYWQLCRKCHKAYDFVEKEHKRNIKGVFI